jgi:hypothetical protein
VAVFKGAKVVFNRGYGAFECVVRNLSDRGARLSLGDTIGVPSYFELKITGEESLRRSRACWRSETALGVSFGSSPSGSVSLQPAAGASAGGIRAGAA